MSAVTLLVLSVPAQGQAMTPAGPYGPHPTVRFPRAILGGLSATTPAQIPRLLSHHRPAPPNGHRLNADESRWPCCCSSDSDAVVRHQPFLQWPRLAAVGSGSTARFSAHFFVYPPPPLCPCWPARSDRIGAGRRPWSKGCGPHMCTLRTRTYVACRELRTNDILTATNTIYDQHLANIVPQLYTELAFTTCTACGRLRAPGCSCRPRRR